MWANRRPILLPGGLALLLFGSAPLAAPAADEDLVLSTSDCEADHTALPMPAESEPAAGAIRALSRSGVIAPRDLAKAEFATLRLRMLKIAARVTETAARVRLAFAAACPEADLFRALPAALLMPGGP